MNAGSAVLAAGALLLVLSALLDLAARAARSRTDRLALLCLAAGAATIAVAGGMAVSGARVRADLSWIDIAAPASMQLDPLSGLFLVICFAVAAAGALHAAGAPPAPPDPCAGRAPRGLPSLLALMLAGVLIVMSASDVYVLVLGWELVTLTFYLVTVFDRDRPGAWRGQAGVIAATAGKASGGAVLVGMLLLAASADSSALVRLGDASGAARDVGYALLLTGFAVKVGLVPVHVWLPRCYAAAPAAARAVMAGAAVNVGFYGMWRTLAVLGPPPLAVALVFVAAAAVSAILGIAHVSVQSDLRRVIAYSSVENAGLIGVGFGTAMIGAVIASPRLVALGVLTATLQVVAHALAKTLLFASAGTVTEQLRTDDLEELRGVSRALPWSSGGFLVGALTLAGLPLTIGFVSEWYLLQALMQLFRTDSDATRLTLAAAGAAVALTAGFAGFAFVRLVGLVLFGPTSPRSARSVTDSGPEGRLAIVALAGACLALAAFAPWLVAALAQGLSPIVAATVTAGANVSPQVLQPVFDGFSSLSPTWMWLMLPALVLVTALVVRAIAGARLVQVRRVPAWKSGAGEVHGPRSYTPYAFANPTRKVLTNVLRPRSTLRPHPPGSAPSPGQAPASYEGDVVEVVEEYLYRPLRRPVLALVTQARRLQSGRLDAYLAYMLVAVIAVLALVAVAAGS